MHLRFICMCTYVNRIYDVWNDIHCFTTWQIVHDLYIIPRKVCGTKSKHLFRINSKSGTTSNNIANENETLSCLLRIREYICEVKVLLLPTIFITFFFYPSPVRLCGGGFLCFVCLLGSFHQKVSHLNCLWGKRMWKMFFWFSFFFGLTVIPWPCVRKIFHRIL